MTVNAYDFDEIARNIFAPAYPLLAEQIIRHSGISAGVCLDLGSGGGYLGLALAGMSQLQVCLIDELEDNKTIAEANINRMTLGQRVRAIKGDVHTLPFQDNSVDLVASRSSVFFWEKPYVAFREIERVLVPGGFAYVGGGFGSEKLRCGIEEQMNKRSADWKPKFEEKKDDAFFTEQLGLAGIDSYLMIQDESGFWISFMKQ